MATAYLDFEGEPGNFVEVGIIFTDAAKDAVAAHVYHIQPRDATTVWRGSKHCHGMVAKDLQRYGQPWATVLNAIKDDMRHYGIEVVVGNGDDIRNFTAEHLPGIVFRQMTLLQWKDRHDNRAHKLAWSLKITSSNFLGTTCNQRKNHPETFFSARVGEGSVWGALCAIRLSGTLFL